MRCIISADDKGNVQKHRERLAASAVGGQARQYGPAIRGKSFTADQVDTLDDSEVGRLYARYEARLGVVITKTLVSAALQFYAGVASMFLPIPVENQPELIADLAGAHNPLPHTTEF